MRNNKFTRLFRPHNKTSEGLLKNPNLPICPQFGMELCHLPIEPENFVINWKEMIKNTLLYLFKSVTEHSVNIC